ncbi:MAG: polyketide cyclase [Veillonellales bacterium]
MTEFTFQTEINASPEKIWKMYTNVKNRFKWESDLEHITLDGEFITGSSGTMKLEGQPAMSFTLTSVVPNQEFWDRTEIPGTGMAICVGHTLTRYGNKTLVKHSMKLEKISGNVSEEDVNFLSQIFGDTPRAVLSIKKAVEA